MKVKTNYNYCISDGNVDVAKVVEQEISGHNSVFAEVILKISLKDLAKALKPYLDSIDNCECKRENRKIDTSKTRSGIQKVNICG